MFEDADTLSDTAQPNSDTVLTGVTVDLVKNVIGPSETPPDCLIDDGKKPHQDEKGSQERQHWQPETMVFDCKKEEVADENDSHIGDKEDEKPLSFFVKKPFLDEKVTNNVTNVANVATLDLSTATDAEAESIDSAMAVIDAALLVCKEDPAVLFKSDFIEAVKFIREDPCLWAEYRVAIKQAKPSGVLLGDIDKATDIYEAGSAESEAVAAKLIALVLSLGSLFFDEKSDKGFLSTDISGVIHTLAIGSKPFVEWLSYAYYQTTKQDSKDGNGFSASEAVIKQTVFALSGIAKHEGDRQRVHLRVADHNGGHYIFVGDDGLQTIEVLPTGWRVIDNAPVKFWKPSSMQALPMPQHGGDLSKIWEFINVPEHDRLLVLAWMLEAYREETPKPILALSGLQGSAKSSTQSKLRELVDNNAVNLRAAPKSTEDVFIGAGCNWLSSYENISHLPSKMQDALCTLATGGGFAARTLYTNDEETIIEVKRPVIINSIPRVITAQDLTDRAICIELPSIEYREELELNAAWESAKPSIFGGLLDLFVKTLAQLPKVKLNKPPRMADFTRLGEAMAQSMGHSASTFDTLYKANRTESIVIALEASPVGLAVREMVDNYTGISETVFYGTVKNLYDALSLDYKRSSESWPKSPRGLSEVIKRQSPALQSLGIGIIQGSKTERIGSDRGLTIKIFKSGNIGNIGNVVSLKFAQEKKIHENSAAFLGDDKTGVTGNTRKIDSATQNENVERF
ncbi:MAG: hypothetical protein Q8N96_07665 [Methylovulum sp.]|nr:hypothetical protein [Methylovulum sp.]